ncbi:MAG: ABC transporter substrate-binding protein [Bdellovibrionaceae bacterium]|nr:ABC transporter substrate-binding protein [Pseudobdellovibrionaceae bacterium]
MISRSFVRLIVGAGLLIAPSAVFAKAFVYCSEGSPSTFNPQQATDGPTFNASSRTIYSRLTEFKTGSTEVQPGLAESWKVSKDGLKYTFTLRKGVKFHSNDFFKPTRDFNADDVVYSFEVQKDKNHPLGQKAATYEYFVSMEMDKLLKDVKKIDDHTVEFVLTRPEAPFLANLAMDFASILSKEYAEQLQKAKRPIETLNTQPIGTGVYKFRSYQKDTLIRFDRNDDYFGKKANVDQLIFAITPDPSVRFQKLKAGECHLVTEPSPQDIQGMKSASSLKVLEAEGLNVGYLAMNVEKKPFDQVKVRKAVAHALNRQAYIKAIYLDRAAVAKNPIPPTMWSYNKKTKEDSYDPALSKKLLKEAGFPNGFETTLWTLPVSRPYNPAGKKMGEMMQADLAAVGIKVKLVTYDWGTYLERARQGQHDILQIGWSGDNGDPDNFLFVLLSCAASRNGANYSRWCDKKFDDLVLKAKQTTDIKARTRLYEEAQGEFAKQSPWVTLAHAKVYRTMSDKVSGYQIHPLGVDILTEVDLK